MKLVQLGDVERSQYFYRRGRRGALGIHWLLLALLCAQHGVAVSEAP